MSYAPHADPHRGELHQHQHQRQHHQQGSDDHARMLDLEAEVLAGHLAAITEWLPVASSPRGVVDLGSGTGAGTFALLDLFPHTYVTAVDSSAVHLQRLREKARARGVEGQVSTAQADLDSRDWPDLGTPDLVWASASMHHLADPDRVLRTVHDTLAPGGLFAVVGLAGFPRFLPDDAPENRPGLEERCHAASDRHFAEHVPNRGIDWAPKLTAAGFSLEAERTFTVRVENSANKAVRTYAMGSLRRLRDSSAEGVPAEDLAVLDRLLDTASPDSILRREDLAVRTERVVWAARRTT
ncbi:class I SAM-dependent methyltransferase [Actinopolymorpha singaporensis]|nr:class I SAM-dependent methyltransferase [Actinopolymorpha singaporensis]